MSTGSSNEVHSFTQGTKLAHSVDRDRGVLTKLAAKDGAEEMWRQRVHKEAKEDEEKRRRDRVGFTDNEFAQSETYTESE